MTVKPIPAAKKKSLPNPVCSPDGTRTYEKKRYKHLDQKIVNILEHRIIRTFLSNAEVQNGSILNVPCGFGRFTDLITAFNTKILFFDLHPQMVDRCKEQFNTQGHAFCNGSIRTLPFKNNSFSAVMSIRFFHHYFEKEDRLDMLGELQRVTKKYVILTYYNETIIHTVIKKLNDRGHKILMLRKKDFYEELHAAGFKPVLEKTVIPFLHAQRFLLVEKI